MVTFRTISLTDPGSVDSLIMVDVSNNVVEAVMTVVRVVGGTVTVLTTLEFTTVVSTDVESEKGIR
jgi:hypothetical protein